VYVFIYRYKLFKLRKHRRYHTCVYGFFMLVDDGIVMLLS